MADEQKDAPAPESEARPCPFRMFGECAGGDLDKKFQFFGGGALAVLVSLLLNDPRMPAPVAFWATVVTVLTLGKAACGGARWVLFESPVAFPGDEPVGFLDLGAKKALWLGFGAALPASVLGTICFIVGRRPPAELVFYVHCVLRSFVPSLILVLASMPMVWKRIQSPLFTDRDRGAFPCALGLVLYALFAALSNLPGLPVHGPLVPIRLIMFALHPLNWPLHLIAGAAGVGVLRCWFACTGGKCGEQAPKG